MKPSEHQKKLRIQLAIFAWAYEHYNESLTDDHSYDIMSRKVDLNIATDRPDLDEWFKEHFIADSGMWIHGHPELNRIDEIVKGMLKSTKVCPTCGQGKTK